MLKEKYKETFDHMKPSQELLNETIRAALETKEKKRAARLWRPVLTTAAAVLCIFAVMPVCARQIPSFYNVIEYISPALADALVPVERESVSQGIVMEVEAIRLEDQEAEIIVSLRDEEGSAEDKICGKADLFDSYHLSDYGSSMGIGGCSFLTYEEETGKAYFKVTLQTDGQFKADKLRFSVREVIGNIIDEERPISLFGLQDYAETKCVTVSGGSSKPDSALLPDSLKASSGNTDDPRPVYRVMDLVKAEDCAADGITVTGMAYMDGVLRLQICMGDTTHADRHVWPILVDRAGNETDCDYSVSWQEEAEDCRYSFYEFWFIGEFENWEDYSMYGDFYQTGESVQGDWNVTFRVEE